MNSDQVANAGVFLSKDETNDPAMKEKIKSARTSNTNAIKLFLQKDSPTLEMRFESKRVTRKRSGKIHQLKNCF